MNKVTEPAAKKTAKEKAAAKKAAKAKMSTGATDQGYTIYEHVMSFD